MTGSLIPFRELVAALWLTLRDRDYRPRYQDEYARLWHRESERANLLGRALVDVRDHVPGNRGVTGSDWMRRRADAALTEAKGE